MTDASLPSDSPFCKPESLSSFPSTPRALHSPLSSLIKEILFILLIMSKPPFHQRVPPSPYPCQSCLSVVEINLHKYALFPPVGFSPAWKCDQLLRVSTNMPAHRLVRHSFNEGGSLGVGGSIARRRLPGRRHRLVRRSFSEGRSLPSSALMPFILVPFVLLVLLVSFLPPPCLPPNPNRTLNLSCLYTLPLRPIHPVAVPGGTLKRFALFASFSTLFPNDCHRPPRPNHCARATCNYAISKPYQFRNTILIFPAFL